jgi:Domain of unknown function (DUF4440)
MKKLLTIFILIFALCIPVTAQSPSPEQEILSREKSWRTALLNASNDLEEIYSKHLSYNDWNGKTHDRATLISDLKSGKLKYQALTARKESVQVTINTAIYSCEFEIVGNYGETSISRTVKILHVWMKEDGTWRLLVHQTQKNS